jgi:putative salt-induced outer membrane protein YdiY
MRTRLLTFAAAIVATVMPVMAQTPAAPAEPQKTERKNPWTDAAEFSLVSVAGNAQSTSLGFSNKFLYKWTRSELGFDVAAIRTKVSDREIKNPDGTVFVTWVDRVTAELYAAKLKYRLNITDRLLWYSDGGWLQNRPSGIDSREFIGTGVGDRFIKTARQQLTGELGLSYTWDSPVEGADKNYSGVRGFLGYEMGFGEANKFNTEIEANQSLKDGKDFLGRFMAGVTAAMTHNLALKVSYTLLYDRQPPQQLVVAENGDPADDRYFTYENVDTFFSASLVVNF